MTRFFPRGASKLSISLCIFNELMADTAIWIGYTCRADGNGTNFIRCIIWVVVIADTRKQAKKKKKINKLTMHTEIGRADEFGHSRKYEFVAEMKLPVNCFADIITVGRTREYQTRPRWNRPKFHEAQRWRTQAQWNVLTRISGPTYARQ